MLRHDWLFMARLAFHSFLCQLDELCAGGRMHIRGSRSKLRRGHDYSLGHVAAELCEARLLLSAAITNVSPNQATTHGATTVQISGTGFNGVTGVMFGTTLATTFAVTSPNHISAVSPPHAAGTVDVVVVTSGGNSTVSSADKFMYTAAAGLPAVTSLGTTIGATAGGASITIAGTNFTNVTGVLFGGVAAPSFTVNSSTSLTATTPAQFPGVVDVKVTNSAGTSATSTVDQFIFVTPALIDTSLNTPPAKTSSGTAIAVTGANLASVTGYPAPPSPPAITWSIPERPAMTNPRTAQDRSKSLSRPPVARRAPRGPRTPRSPNSSRTATHPPEPARSVK